MHNVKLFLYSRLAHNRQVVTGFHELKRRGEISLEIIENYDGAIDERIPDRRIVEAIIDGKRVAFDMIDGYCYPTERINQYLEVVDYYFKRSFSSDENEKFSKQNKHKIYPLSFNWDVSFFSNPLEWTRSISDLKMLIKKFTYRNDIKYYENRVRKETNNILFMCRLWAVDGSEQISEKSKEQRIQINTMRIGIVRALKEKYGSNFIGGIENSKTAQELCPDLILPKSMTMKPKYIKTMKRSSICIASTGLFNSIGWKFAEYVAAGKAIVSEKLNYQVIGDFAANKNYLEYSTVEECLDAVELLYNNVKLKEVLEKNNKNYYYYYSRPDKQMEYVLKTIN